MKLSKQDLKILELLQIDVKTSVEHLSEEVGLSTASIQRHLKRLRNNKVIAQEVAIISPNAVNQSMTLLYRYNSIEIIMIVSIILKTK